MHIFVKITDMKKILMIAAVLALAACANERREAVSSGGTLFDIYDGPAPGSEICIYPERELEDEGNRYLLNISSPTLEMFTPEDPDGSAVVVLPGGGFYLLSYNNEGVFVAQKMASHGVTAFVLKYRTTPVDLGDNCNPANIGELWGAINAATEAAERAAAEEAGPSDSVYEQASRRSGVSLAFADADRALAFVRENAEKFGIDPDRIGIMGFSAGAITTLHQIQEHSDLSRPDFAGVIYGGWDGSFKTPDDPMPVFMCSPTNDLFSVEESVSVFEAMRASGQPVEHHFFSKCVHGYGAAPTGTSVDCWPDLFAAFLKDCGIVSK